MIARWHTILYTFCSVDPCSLRPVLKWPDMSLKACQRSGRRAVAIGLVVSAASRYLFLTKTGYCFWYFVHIGMFFSTHSRTPKGQNSGFVDVCGIILYHCRCQVYLKKGALYFLSSKKDALHKLQDGQSKVLNILGLFEMMCYFPTG